MAITQQSPNPVNTGQQLVNFENLMPFRVHNVLLVSSLYDAFILREDGQLNELLIDESLELNLLHTPDITHVPSGHEALEAVRKQHFDLIVSNVSVADMEAGELISALKEQGFDIPVVVLAYDQRELKSLLAQHPAPQIEKAFLWQGNPRILLTIVKYLEDKRNAVHDAEVMGVPVVVVVEDDVRYYSAFLPEIYTALIMQSRRILSEGFNAAQKMVRMRARPKILLCESYEEAMQKVVDFRDYLFGVVSDIEFPRCGEMDSHAGLELARMVREMVPDIPVVLQSSEPEYAQIAHSRRCSFVRKGSETLLAELRALLSEQFAFGDFVFRLPSGEEVGRAKDLNALEEELERIPIESLIYHGERNDFSHWLIARTEFALAQKLRPRKVSDFANPEDLRTLVIEQIADYRREQEQVLVGDFHPDSFHATPDFFLRYGGGSLGGKARGLTFVRNLLHKYGVSDMYGGVRVAVPPTLVLCTDLFDRFMAENDLLAFAMHCEDEGWITERFLKSQLPTEIRDVISAFLKRIKSPLAVRSSSMLEDSQYQPFTGVYETFMLPNHAPSLETRVEDCCEAVKRVYASVFSHRAKAYVRATAYRLEQEKMAVMLQEVVGATHHGRFYPDFSGVVRSRNFYPIEPMTAGDGVAAVALGLGRTVVEGGRCLTFCPKYPRKVMQFSTYDDIVANAQSEFLALDMEAHEDLAAVSRLREKVFDLRTAEQDGTLAYVGSTYSPDNQAVYDGLSRPGMRVVTFAPVLKHNVLPLAAVLDTVQKMGEAALGRPVEIEFAVRMARTAGEPSYFGFLQMRPLVWTRDGAQPEFHEVDDERVLCRSTQVLGSGRIEELRDIVVVDYNSYRREDSANVAAEIGRINARLTAKNIPYLLIGVGRWGSRDPWLGIPVTWDQVSGARAIVEAGFRDLRVTPSQGSHFFQNLSAFQVSYFTVNPDLGEGRVDWDWLASQPALEERGAVRQIHTTEPVIVVTDASHGRGVILKPTS